MNKQLEKEFNLQIKHETESAYLYLAMGAWFKSENLDGLATWMQAQALEEMGHAMRFHNHLLDRGAEVKFQDLKIEKNKWKSAVEAFQDTVKHEQFITARIHFLVEQSTKHKDSPARNFLEWFVNEQVEEEAIAGKILADLKRVGDSGHGLLMIDRELGARPLALPVLGPAGAGAGA
jgi:ferritin